jgi:hypothetical protein
MIMKKVLVALLILLLPFSAMAAMTSISDNELAEVTGQVGVSIALVDFTMDMSIANFTYDDTDTGTVIVSNRDVDFTAGYINIGPIVMDNIYVTLAGNPVYANGATVNSAKLRLAAVSSMTALAAIGSGYNGIGGQMLEIDVMTADGSTANPYYSVRGKSGVLIGIPDMFISLDGIVIDGIYADSVAGDATGVFLPYAEKWLYTQDYTKQSDHSFGSFHINGINIHMYSSVPGLFTDGAFEYRHTFALNEDAGGNPVRVYPGNRAYLLIAPH